MNARGPKGPRRSWHEADLHLYDPVRELTAAQNKIWVSLQGKLDTPELKKKVIDLRKKLGIAPEGSRKRPSDLDQRGLVLSADSLRQELELDFMWILTIADYILHNELRWHSSFGGLIEVTDEGAGYDQSASESVRTRSQLTLLTTSRRPTKQKLSRYRKNTKKPRAGLDASTKRIPNSKKSEISFLRTEPCLQKS